ncbi:60S ribosomal protein L18a-like protein [Amaranthus tricolor]|uniref:60S ribosomal protein L18a-like protein n=1 Tax=Amaranthus tricolor TaxID=29722 RepID=UPI002585D6DB|nr:60S ribosomal protein L18a-like protein [Amaranthus tricolor]
MSEEGKIVYHHHERHGDSDQAPPPPPPVVPQYGTFQGVPSSPAMGFPQPAPPPGAMDLPPDYYTRGYQAVPGYAVVEGMPMGEHRLPCCGIGCGWFLFIIGFFLAGIPWYFAAILLICCRNVEPREKPGYVACTIAAVLAIIATIFGVSKLND